MKKIFENLKIEVDFKQEQNGKKFEDIKIRKGWRMLKLRELDKVMNYIVDNKLKVWSYFEQPIETNKGEYVARFCTYSGWASLGCFGYPLGSDSALGVIFCKDIK